MTDPTQLVTEVLSESEAKGALQSVLDLESLQRAESLYRRSLEKDPGDMISRRSLAWSLFIRSIYQAGVETHPRGEEEGETQELESRRLLLDCLRQISTVLQLSRNAQDLREMQHLRNLIRLSGADAAVSASEIEALEILSALAREFLSAQEASPRRLRRMRTRSQEP